MIGPQAYENLFLTKKPIDVSAFVLECSGYRFYYTYDWEDLALFEGRTPFLRYIIENVDLHAGEDADMIETIYADDIEVDA